MKIENIEVFGFRSALRSMRNPMNSWEKSDSLFYACSPYSPLNPKWNSDPPWGWGSDIFVPEDPYIGPEDFKLMMKLIRGGTEHRKFLRTIHVNADFTLPRYVWTEFDTYKIATVRNSCSTMHKLGRMPISQEDFEAPIPNFLLFELNHLGQLFRETKNFDIVREMKNILPEGFLQKANMDLNYETILNIYSQRKNHRLPQWNCTKLDSGVYSICKWIEDLPYMKHIFKDIYE